MTRPEDYTYDYLVFDIETDGFYDDCTVVHSLCVAHPGTNKRWSFTDHEWGDKAGSIADGLELLKLGRILVGHNIVKYDLPVLRKLCGFSLGKYQEAMDTLILSKLIYTDLNPWDKRLMNAGTLPGRRFGSHALEAWGYRLNCMKGEYTDLPIHWERALLKWGAILVKEGCKVLTKASEFAGNDWEEVLKKACQVLKVDVEPFAEWLPEMQEYCDQDVEVTLLLWDHLKDKPVSQQALLLEHNAYRVCEHMERAGFLFDIAKAEELQAQLMTERLALKQQLIASFGSWWAPTDGFDDSTKLPNVRTPAKTMDKKLVGFPNITERRFSEKTGKELKPYVGPPKITYTEGCPFTPVEYVTFSPSSRDDIANRLKAKYQWTPTSFTKTGKPVIDDTTLKGLADQYEECALLARYFMLEKRLGQLAEGRQAWLKMERDGFIRGTYQPNGAVTGRATHSYPNIAQVPAADEKVPYGPEFRSLFGVPEGWTLLGSDLSGLELRCLGHFMARYDGGAYLEELLAGDIHWTNVLALGLVPPGTEKDEHDPWHMTARNKIAKTFIYAFLYGAGDEKIGRVYTEHRPLTDEEVAQYSNDRKVLWMLNKQGRKATRREVAGIAYGRMLKERFLEATPAIKLLREAIDGTLVERQNSPTYRRMFLNGLDGRELHVRARHAALNTLLQSAGALLCKKWLHLTFDALVSSGLKPGFLAKDGTWWALDGTEADFVFCAWVHDEIAVGCRTPEIAEKVAAYSKSKALKAGEYFNFRAPIEAGDVKLGKTWAETH